LAAAGVSSTGEEIHEFGNAQTRENDPAPEIAPDSGNSKMEKSYPKISLVLKEDLLETWMLTQGKLLL
jgi:hypothetical protein